MKIGGRVDWDVDKSVGARVDRDVGSELWSVVGGVGLDVDRFVGDEVGRGIGGGVGSGSEIDRYVGDGVGSSDVKGIELEVSGEFDLITYYFQNVHTVVIPLIFLVVLIPKDNLP